MAWVHVGFGGVGMGLRENAGLEMCLGGDEKACVTIHSWFQRDVIYPTK